MSSLVLFATQVNVERMPHGLFRKFSSDPQLMGLFAFAFTLALGVLGLSQAAAAARMPYIVAATAGLVALLLISVPLSYRRALDLISPTTQLQIVTQDALRDLRKWQGMADVVTQVIKVDETGVGRKSGGFDVRRASFYNANNGWAGGAKTAVDHAISYARLYNNLGDYEICGLALKAAIDINIG